VAALAFSALTLAAGSVWAATINGTARNDTLRGGARADKISGKAGDDKLYGAGGNDVLVGGAGSDILVGGVGADEIRCGPDRDTAIRDVQDKVAKDCEVVRGPRPVPPPPPAPPEPSPPPPAPAPGAPATYVFGPEVSQAQQTAVRDALDLGARYYRTALGREVPQFNVWAYRDLEALIRVFAETSSEAPTVEQARALWARGLVAHANNLRMWIGPLWFENGTASAKKILAKEEFIILLYAIAGTNALNSGQDDIPRAGPRWLSEGTAELIAHLAIADARLVSMQAVRGDWGSRAKSSPVTLERLAILRGQFEAGANAWGIMPLAVERLVGEGGIAKVIPYFEAVAVANRGRRPSQGHSARASRPFTRSSPHTAAGCKHRSSSSGARSRTRPRPDKGRHQGSERDDRNLGEVHAGCIGVGRVRCASRGSGPVGRPRA
jgi:hypothetical protein